jgi:hypothetical protein
VVGLLVSAGCTGTVIGPSGSTGGGGSTGTTTSGCGRVPDNHVPQASGPCGLPEPGTPCMVDADCVGAPCKDFGTVKVCDPNFCTTDSDCAAPNDLCACSGQYNASAGSTCVQADCHTDADCGPGGYCSPSIVGYCGQTHLAGFFCHTCADTCVNDKDCTSPAFCGFDPTVGHWACALQICAG